MQTRPRVWITVLSKSSRVFHEMRREKQPFVHIGMQLTCRSVSLRVAPATFTADALVARESPRTALYA